MGRMVYNRDKKRLIVGDGATNLDELQSADEPDFAVCQTTDATLTDLVTIPLTDDTIGTVEMMVMGGKAAGGGSLVYHSTLIYVKESGAITPTLTTLASVSTIGGGSTWSIDYSSGDAVIKVTGIAATTINWKIYYKMLSHAHI